LILKKINCLNGKEYENGDEQKRNSKRKMRCEVVIDLKNGSLYEKCRISIVAMLSLLQSLK
jgi:hypothetical protein